MSDPVSTWYEGKGPKMADREVVVADELPTQDGKPYALVLTEDGIFFDSSGTGVYFSGLLPDEGKEGVRLSITKDGVLADTATCTVHFGVKGVVIEPKETEPFHE